MKVIKRFYDINPKDKFIIFKATFFLDLKYVFEFSLRITQHPFHQVICGHMSMLNTSLVLQLFDLL